MTVPTADNLRHLAEKDPDSVSRHQLDCDKSMLAAADLLEAIDALQLQWSRYEISSEELGDVLCRLLHPEVQP